MSGCLKPTMHEGTTVIVKFVRSYGEAVHGLLADVRLAPKLRTKVTELAGGWQAVVMEKVSGTTAFELMGKKEQLKQEVMSDLEKAVTLMHHSGSVWDTSSRYVAWKTCVNNKVNRTSSWRGSTLAFNDKVWSAGEYKLYFMFL